MGYKNSIATYIYIYIYIEKTIIEQVIEDHQSSY